MILLRQNPASYTQTIIHAALMFAAVVVGTMMLSSNVRAHSYKLDDIAVGHIWAPPPKEGADALPVYGPILNSGDTATQLVSATTPASKQVRFRVEEDGQVRWPEVIEFTPGKPLALAPWREHIWITGLKKPLKSGDSFALSLDFGKAGSLTVKVLVEEASEH